MKINDYARVLTNKYKCVNEVGRVISMLKTKRSNSITLLMENGKAYTYEIDEVKKQDD